MSQKMLFDFETVEEVEEFIKQTEDLNFLPEDLQIMAMLMDHRRYAEIVNPTEKVKLATVSVFGDKIFFMDNPSEELCQAAVSNDGQAIRYIKNPSLKVQLLAVQRSPEAIMYLENASEEVQLAALAEDSTIITVIKKPTENALMLSKLIN